jgi:DNA-binding NtrC family response regulator
LLRIIEGAPFQRVGGGLFIQPNVQFVCATNRDLKQSVKAGKFREDLLYRLDQLSFILPPLNQRKEDVPLLGGYYWLRFKRRYRVDAAINLAMLERLTQHSWPGNVRELANTIMKWVVDAKNEAMTAGQAKTSSLPEKLKILEAALIHDSLKRHGSKSKAAQALGLPFSTLRSKLKKIDIRADVDPDGLHLTFPDDGLSLTEKLNLYETDIISEGLRCSDTQSEAARVLGIPLSTLRSKLKKHNIEAR